MTADAVDPHIGLVVEGAGDVNAVPVLLRNYLQKADDYRDVLGKPVPFHGKGNATTLGGLEGYVKTAANRPGCVGVIVILDADEACPAEEGPSLLERAGAITAKPVVIAIAERDFEDWLYASVESLELNPDLTYDAAKRGKSVIGQSLHPRKYAKPTWQPRLAARIDLSLARERNSSLNRLFLKFDELVALVPS